MYLYRSVAFLCLLHFVFSLEVTPNSACSSLCDTNIANGADPSSDEITKTYSSDLVCSDYEYDGFRSTEVGRRFKDCLSCELNSTATDSRTDQSDVYWALFHMKFTVAWCLFAYPENTNITLANNQCADICSGPKNTMKPVLVNQLFDANISAQYLYCTDEDGAFSKTTNGCKQCLRSIPSTKVLTNFLDALNRACDQRPSPKNLLKLDSPVFLSVPTLILDSRTTSGLNSGATSSEELASKPSSTSTSSVAVLSAAISSTETPKNSSLEASSATPSQALYPPLSSSAAAWISTFSAVTTSTPTVSSSAAYASTEASGYKSQDNVVQIGVGVGVGLGGTAAVSVAVGILVWWWRQYKLKLKNEAHDRRKKGFRIRHLQDGIPKPERHASHNDHGLPEPQHQGGHNDYGVPEGQHRDTHSNYGVPELQHRHTHSGYGVPELQHQDSHCDYGVSEPRSQDGHNSYSVQELHVSEFITKAYYGRRTMPLSLSDFITEDGSTRRTTQLREPDFVIEADVVPPLTKSDFNNRGR